MEAEKDRLEKATDLWHEGYRAHLQGELSSAMHLYQESIQLHPTAEAFTFLGWAYSSLKRYEQAIEACKDAIAIDPEFGNPYNDIGSYLTQLNRLDEAIPWLEHALRTKRYEPRHFPHINLGRIYWRKGDLLKAVSEFGKAIEIEPRHRFARLAFATLSAQLN